MLSSPIVQVAYFVSDIREGAARMTETLGAGPFFIADRIELAHCELRGEPGDFLHSSAFGQSGELMVELVQQDSEGRSPFRDMFEAGETGLHHVATMVDDLAETLAHYAALGYDIAARAETTTGIEFAYVDTVARLGHMVEVYEGSAAMRDLYAMVREASIDWDGSHPLRPLGV